MTRCRRPKHRRGSWINAGAGWQLDPVDPAARSQERYADVSDGGVITVLLPDRRCGWRIGTDARRGATTSAAASTIATATATTDQKPGYECGGKPNLSALPKFNELANSGLTMYADVGTRAHGGVPPYQQGGRNTP